MAINEPAAIALSARELHIHIGENLILDHENVNIREGERVGVVGRNGAGKSTMLRVLTGTDSFYTGEITTRRGLRSSYLTQEVELENGETVRENILDGARDVLELIARYETLDHESKAGLELEAQISALDGWDLERRVETLSSALSTPPLDRFADTLSGGEKRRVGLCRALVGQPDLLVLDEPTNHLDAETIEWLESFLIRFRGACLFITHDRQFLDRVSTRILELSQGHLYESQGNYSDFLRNKAKREENLEMQEARRLSFLRREIDWIRRGPKARGTKQRGRIQRFEAAANQAALEREQDVELVIPPAPRLANRVVDLKGVSMTLGGKKLFANFDFKFEPGMRLGIVGRNGMGKTTLLRIILGELSPDEGTVRIGERTEFNYADQHRLSLNDENTVFEEVGEGKDFVMLGNQKLTLWAYLKRFLFTDDEINIKVGQLSGGERNRLVLAKNLKHGGNFLILDEPTNDLDLATLRILEEGLENFGGCVVVVSHDRYFLNRICTGILAFEGEDKLHYEPGDYDYYSRQHRARAERAKAEEEPVEKVEMPVVKAKPSKRKLKWAEERELEAMEETIFTAESAVEELEALFSSPDFFQKHGQDMPELTAKLEAARAEVTRLYARWEELEAIRDGDS